MLLQPDGLDVRRPGLAGLLDAEREARDCRAPVSFWASSSSMMTAPVSKTTKLL